MRAEQRPPSVIRTEVSGDKRSMHHPKNSSRRACRAWRSAAASGHDETARQGSGSNGPYRGIIASLQHVPCQSEGRPFGHARGTSEARHRETPLLGEEWESGAASLDAAIPGGGLNGNTSGARNLGGDGVNRRPQKHGRGILYRVPTAAILERAHGRSSSRVGARCARRSSLRTWVRLVRSRRRLHDGIPHDAPAPLEQRARQPCGWKQMCTEANKAKHRAEKNARRAVGRTASRRASPHCAREAFGFHRACPRAALDVRHPLCTGGFGRRVLPPPARSQEIGPTHSAQP